ncbi:hypothetical protein FORMA_13090 [Formosa sp. Hel3_A1_48]|nr:hypothetical protein FORMA_13090 [Formosa sp. Hel3_A1_48]
MSINTIFIDKFSKKSHIFLNYGIKKKRLFTLFFVHFD